MHTCLQCRVALPLGPGPTCDAVIVSPDLRSLSGAPVFWATPAERSLVGRVLRAGRTGTAEGDT